MIQPAMFDSKGPIAIPCPSDWVWRVNGPNSVTLIADLPDLPTHRNRHIEITFIVLDQNTYSHLSQYCTVNQTYEYQVMEWIGKPVYDYKGTGRWKKGKGSAKNRKTAEVILNILRGSYKNRRV